MIILLQYPSVLSYLFPYFHPPPLLRPPSPLSLLTYFHLPPSLPISTSTSPSSSTLVSPHLPNILYLHPLPSKLTPSTIPSSLHPPTPNGPPQLTQTNFSINQLPDHETNNPEKNTHKSRDKCLQIFQIFQIVLSSYRENFATSQKHFPRNRPVCAITVACRCSCQM